MGRNAQKTALIRQAGALTVTVQREESPYKYVTVEGTVVRTDQPPSAEQMLAIVRRYLPEEQAQGFVQAELAHPGSGLVLFTIRPDRWLTGDFTEEGAWPRWHRGRGVRREYHGPRRGAGNGRTAA